MSSLVTVTPVEVEIAPRADEPSHRRRGRPLGSKGSQIARVKRRLALLVVTAKSTRQMAKAFGVTERTIRTWLRDAEVQDEIGTLEQELRARTERQLMRLFAKSIIAAEKLLDGTPPKKGYARPALRVIELLWTALGLVPPKGARITFCNHVTTMGAPRYHRPGSFGHQPQLDPEDARVARRLLRAERERQEREKTEKHESPPTNGPSE